MIPGSTVGGTTPFGETLGMTPVDGEQNQVTGREEGADPYLPMEPFIAGIGLHHAQWPNRLSAAEVETDSTVLSVFLGVG
jgi:hypothetical protein